MNVSHLAKFALRSEAISGTSGEVIRLRRVPPYLLGISYRGVEDFLTALGYPVNHVTVYRDVQEAGEKIRELREEWLTQAGRVRVVGGDPTHARCGGEDVVLGVAVEAREGSILTIDVLDNEQTETLCQWLQPLLEAVDADVLKTDDADAFKAVADRSGGASDLSPTRDLQHPQFHR